MSQGFLKRAKNEYINGINKCEEVGAKSFQVSIERSIAENLIYAEHFKDACVRIQKSMEMAKSFGIRVLLFELQYDKGLLHFILREKKKLKTVIAKLKYAYKAEFQKEARYIILTGLYKILDGSINSGLKILDKGIDILKSQHHHFTVFVVLYLCSRQFQSIKISQEKIDEYTNKAIEIAKQYNMTGWLEKLCPKKGVVQKQPLTISCLGSLMIEHPVIGWINLNQLEWAKPRQLFSILLTNHLTREKTSKEKIGALLWPELTAKKLTNVFHVTLSSLKKVIGKEYIRYRNRSYELYDVKIDCSDFKERITEADTLLKAGKIHTAETILKRAMDLYQGDYLSDYYDTWLDSVRHEVSGLYRRGLLLLGEILLQKLKFSEAEEIGKKMLQRDPFDEEGHRFLMRSYAASGEKALAIQQYDRCLLIFTDQLHCQPSEQTQQLYHDIRE